MIILKIYALWVLFVTLLLFIFRPKNDYSGDATLAFIVMWMIGTGLIIPFFVWTKLSNRWVG
jgi:hypothetical protein